MTKNTAYVYVYQFYELCLHGVDAVPQVMDLRIHDLVHLLNSLNLDQICRRDSLV